MRSSRFRHFVEAIGLAATLGATSAKAEQPLMAPEDPLKAGITKKVNISPLEAATEVIKLDEAKIHTEDKIAGFNPNGLYKPPKDVVDGLSREIEIARDFAFKLAVDPKIDKPEETKGYAGIEIKL